MYSTARSSESESAVHDSGQLKKYHDLSGVLTALQQNIEEAKAEYKNYQITAASIGESEKKLVSLKEEIERTEILLRQAQHAFEQVYTEVKIINKEKDDLLSFIEKVKTDLSSLQKESIEHEGYIANLKKTASDLDVVITKKHEAHRDLIVKHEAEIQQMEQDQKTLSLALLDGKNLLDFYSNRKDKAEELINDKKAEHENILLDVEKATSVRDALREQNRKDQEEHFKIIKESADKLDEREQGVKKREGDASLKESWLLDKENSLRNIKTELEKHYNRKFDNIKF